MSISTLTADDFDGWAPIWRQYLAFYKTELPESQYRNTFQRIIDPSGDLEAFVLRDDNGHIFGLCHYFFHQSAWTDKAVCYLNGKSHANGR
jgi:hypothetical protein